MIADSVASCVAAGKRVDLRRRALLRRLPRRSRVRAALPAGRGRGRRGERDPVRHERLVAAGGGGRGHRAGRGRTGRRLSEIGIHTHDDAGCGVANALVAVEAGRPSRAGHDERLRRALRQRQPDLDPAGPRAQAGLRCDWARPAAATHRDGAPGRRDLQRHARTRTSPTWAPTRSLTRAACTWPGSTGTRAPSSTSTRRRWAPTAAS